MSGTDSNLQRKSTSISISNLVNFKPIIFGERVLNILESGTC